MTDRRCRSSLPATRGNFLTRLLHRFTRKREEPTTFHRCLAAHIAMTTRSAGR